MRTSLDYRGTPLLTPHEVRATVERIVFRDYEFEVYSHHELVWLRVVHGELDSDGSGNVTTQRGREWEIEGFFTEDEIYRTALRAVLDFQEHETREAFRVDGVPIFHSHPKVEAALRAATPEMRKL